MKPSLAQIKHLTGVQPRDAFVDRDFRGQRYHPKAVAVYMAGRRNLSAQWGKLLKRRAAIEPIIGHTKGDRVNAMLSACAWNLKKLWRYFVEHPLPVPIT